jgi:aminopeptidase N
VNTAFAYYLDEKTRNELSPKLEEVLLGKMQTAETLGQKITFYRAFLNVVSSEKGKDLLKDFLKPKPQSQRPFEFKTKDKFDIIAKLLILGDKDTEKLLAELTKTETSDDAKRYTYAALAGIPTAENKSKYWQDFVANKEISESWIEASFGNFNSPKHSDLTVGYLEKALSELPNLKKNRKIFFVNGWLGAFIGGQKSEQALQIVNKFLADNPNLDKDLKLKILENADIIERAVKIRQKFANAK